MYRFLDLTLEQKHERRYLLDYYAAFAQFSVLFPLLLLQIYRLGAWIVARQRRSASIQPSSSPYMKEGRTTSRAFDSRRLKAAVGIFRWWCGDSVELHGIYIGTNGEILGASAWMIWLLVLCFVQTGEDYFHITKRFGIIAGSQLPFHYLLSMKSPYSPIQVLTGSSHETLISIHQLVGRMIMGLVYLHAIFYFYSYIVKGLVLAKLQEFYIICGIFAVVAFTVIGVTSIAPFRARRYRLFYAAHVILASLLLPCLYFHVSHIRLYLYETAAIYLLSTVLRVFHTHTVSADLALVSESSGLLSITIATPQPRLNAHAWQPGQHGYLSAAGASPFVRTLHSNPFTAACVPALDGGKLRFVARVLDGNTAALTRDAGSGRRLALEGPYGVAGHADRLLGFDRVLFVAGGVGATFVVPLYRQLLADLSPSAGAYRRQKVSFVWAVRALAETGWAVPAAGKEREGFVERLKVHVTGGVRDRSALPDGTFVVGDDDDVRDHGSEAEAEEGIELEERKTLLADSSGENEGMKTAGMAVLMGRPNLVKAVEQVFSHDATERVAVVVCGPRSLSQALRREVGRMVMKGRDVFFWEESFTL